MRRVVPKVFLVGETRIVGDGLKAYLDHIGAPDWDTNAPSDAEKLVEVYGRMCYRSWAPLMNPNVTKVRNGNDKYISNIISSQHGSVIEHPVTNWILADVSRVFTHELVRHRVGTAFSQESLRYVRLNDLGLWLPPQVEHDQHLKELFETTFRNLEQLQIAMAEYMKLDDVNDFHHKKLMTSAMRRVAPCGLATTIGVSMNFRTLRHIIELRSSNSAEVEIRLVIDQIMQIAKNRWPNVFYDFESVPGDDGINQWVPKFHKI